MPKPNKRKGGVQGESGMTPAGVNTKQGAYGYSARYMGGANTPNAQGWNSYDGERSQRGGSIGDKHRGTRMSGDGSDY